MSVDMENLMPIGEVAFVEISGSEIYLRGPGSDGQLEIALPIR